MFLRRNLFVEKKGGKNSILAAKVKVLSQNKEKVVITGNRILVREERLRGMRKIFLELVFYKYSFGESK